MLPILIRLWFVVSVLWALFGVIAMGSSDAFNSFSLSVTLGPFIAGPIVFLLIRFIVRGRVTRNPDPPRRMTAEWVDKD